MNRGVIESSPVQHLTAAGNPNWWNNGGLRPPPPQLPPSTTTTTNLHPSFLPNFFPSPTSSSSYSPSLPLTSSPNFSSWLDNSYDLPLDQPWSRSQLLLGGLMMGEEERIEIMNYYHNQNQQHGYQEKKLEYWEEQVLKHQESKNNNGYVIMSSPNSPLNKSCVTTTTIHNNNNHNGLNLSECNSSKIGHESSFANKKPKLQVPSSSQPTLKVRKEKLGGRITALHQLVSPFGKTDTASVLSEAIGYIRFLHSQIEALSLPYFGVPSRHNMTHQHAQGGMHCIFPEDPGQLVNDYCMKMSKGASFSSSTNNQESNPNEEPKEDLRSRGLCLVPISCTLQVGNDNGADYWTPAF